MFSKTRNPRKLRLRLRLRLRLDLRPLVKLGPGPYMVWIHPGIYKGTYIY